MSHEETEGVVHLAREYRRGGNGKTKSISNTGVTPDLQKASQLYKKAIEQGQGPSSVDALFELASLNTQSPSDNFVLLSKYVPGVVTHVSCCSVHHVAVFMPPQCHSCVCLHAVLPHPVTLPQSL